MDSALRKLSFSSDATEKVLTDWHVEELLSCLFLLPPDEAPFARLSLEESDADGEDEVADGMEEAHKVRRDIKVKKYGSGGGGSIERVEFSTDVSRNGGARGRGTGSNARNKSLVGVSDITE